MQTLPCLSIKHRQYLYLYTQRYQSQTAYSLLTSPVKFLDLMKNVEAKRDKGQKRLHHF